MGITASSCFSKNQKVDSIQIEKPQLVVAVQTVKSEILKSASTSCSIVHVSPTASAIQPENDRTFSRTLMNEVGKSFAPVETTERQSICSKFETHELIKSSSEFWKDQDENEIRRPANPTPRESDALLGAVLSGSVEVRENISQVSAFKPKSEVNLNANAIASQSLCSESFNQAGLIITSKIQSDLMEGDHNSSVVAKSSSTYKPVSLGSSLLQFPKPLQTGWLKGDSSLGADDCNAPKPSHPLDSLPIQKPPALPSLSLKKERPKRRKSSRVPVFTDPLIVDSDVQYDDLSVQTATREPLLTLNEIPGTDLGRKLRPLHGKSSSRVPVFTDPLLLSDCGEECEKEIFVQTREPQLEGVGSGDGFVKDTTDSQLTRGRIRLAPLEMGKKPRPLHGRSSNRVPVFTDPLIVGKDKPAHLKNIPEPLKKKTLSQSWKPEVDKIFLGHGGRHDSILPTENRSDERLLEVINQHSEQMLLDGFTPIKTLDVGQGTRPKLAALKNPSTSSSQSRPSEDSFPFTDLNGQVASTSFTTNSEKSFEEPRSLSSAIDSETLHRRDRKFSNVRLDPLNSNTRSSSSEQGQGSRPEQ